MLGSSKASIWSRLAAAAAAMAAAAMAAGTKELTLAQAEANAAMMRDPQSGRHAYRGRPGTKAFQRAAKKARNVRRFRAANRG